VNPVKKQFKYGDQTVTLETGRVARQASGAVVASIGETVVLCTVVAAKTAVEGDWYIRGTSHFRRAI